MKYIALLIVCIGTFLCIPVLAYSVTLNGYEGLIATSCSLLLLAILTLAAAYLKAEIDEQKNI